MKALRLLDEVVGECGALKLPENRAWVQAQAASLLWKFDEARARQLFRESLVSLRELSDLAADDAPDGGLRQTTGEVLAVVAEHDLPAAREYLRSLSPPPPPDLEHQLILNAAARLADADPPRSLPLAREALSMKVSSGLVDVLSRLRKTEPGAAATLAGEIIDRLRGEDLTSNYEAAGVAFAMLALSQGPARGEPRTAAPVSRDEFRALAEMTVAAALRTSPNQPLLLLMLRPSLTEVEAAVPALAPRLRRQLAAKGYDGKRDIDEPPSQTAPGPAGAPPNGHRSTAEESAAEITGRALAAHGDGRRGLALQLLEEAGDLLRISERAGDAKRLDAQLKIARAYLAVEPERGLTILESMAFQLNELASAAVVVNGFLNGPAEGLARGDELSLRALQEAFGEQLSGDEFRHVARTSFERAVGVADRFQRTEVRTLARLLIVRHALSEAALSQR